MTVAFGFFIVLPLWGCVALVFNFLFRFIMKPLRVPAERSVESKRDRKATFIIFLSLIFLRFGCLIVLCTYLIGVYRHFRDRRRLAPGARPTSLPRIPQVSLSDLLVMVFSVGFFPLLVSQLIVLFSAGHVASPEQMRSIQVPLFILGAAVFPLCFVSALYRLESNRVPRGKVRTLFLAIYPYLLFSTAAGALGLFVAVLLLFDRWIWPTVVPQLVALLCVVALALGRHVASLAKNEADAAKAQGNEPIQIVNETEKTTG